jgi:hypothetical protein
MFVLDLVMFANPVFGKTAHVDIVEYGFCLVIRVLPIHGKGPMTKKYFASIAL